MNCRDIEPLLLAERDSVLTSDQHASLERHVAACLSCQQLRARLREALDAYRTDAANVAVPDADAEWLTLRTRLQGAVARPVRPRQRAPVIWFGSSLGAAAALALVFLNGPRQSPNSTVAAPMVAQAEFVEAGDNTASTLVYVDKDSGWLVVWAADRAPNTNG